MACAIIFALHFVARIVCAAIEIDAIFASLSGIFRRALARHHVRIVDRARAAIHAVVGARVRLTLFIPETDVAITVRTAQSNGALTVATAKALAHTVLAAMSFVVVGTLATWSTVCVTNTNTLILTAQFVAILAIVAVEAPRANARLAAVQHHRAGGTIQA